MIVKLLTEHHLEYLSLIGGCTGLYKCIHLSKCHIVGNHMSRLQLFVFMIWLFYSVPDFVCFDALQPSQQFFSHVRSLSCLPGLNQYKAEDKVSCSRIQCSASNETRTSPQSGAQWLSGRVLDLRPKGGEFEPHQRHCVGVLEQDTFILA